MAAFIGSAISFLNVPASSAEVFERQHALICKSDAMDFLCVDHRLFIPRQVSIFESFGDQPLVGRNDRTRII